MKLSRIPELIGSNKSARSLIIAALVATNAGLFWYTSRSGFVTTNEARQIPAGLSHWKAGIFSMANDTPPLARLIAVLPLLPSLHYYEVSNEIALPFLAKREIEENYANRFWLMPAATRSLDLVARARLAGFVWWLLGACLIVRWSSDLYGKAAGLFGLALWSVEPNILAYEGLATPDLPAAVVGAWATYRFWCYLNRPSLGNAFVAGFLLGIAQLTDYTLLALYAVWPVLWLIHFMARPRESGKPAVVIGRQAGYVFSVLIVSLWVINLGYGFSESGLCLKDFPLVSRVFRGDSLPNGSDVEHLKSPFAGSRFASWIVPLPAGYVLGIDRRWREAESQTISPGADGRPAPVWGHFTWASLAVKVPLGLWGLALWAAILVPLRREDGIHLPDELHVWIPLAMLSTIAAFQIGVDFPMHWIVVLIPYLIVGASRLVSCARPGGWRASGLVVTLAMWTTVSSLAAYPYSLAYLNESVGGPGNVAAQVRFGNIDCGQDIQGLRDWLDNHPEVKTVGIALRQVVDPRTLIWRMDDTKPPINPGPKLAHNPSYRRRIGPYPGYFALDSYHLSQSFYQYFEGFKPIVQVGNSIFVYHIVRAEANQARQRLGLPTLGGDAEEEERERARGFQSHVYKDPSGKTINYTLFVPYDYTGEESYPLLVSFNGFGDRGYGGQQYLRVGAPTAIKRRQDSFGFFVLYPQGQTGYWHADSQDFQLTLGILADIEKRYNVDPKRVSLTGWSSGGGGTWDIAMRYPEQWAAIVPVAGGGSDPSRAHLIKDIPCWCFNNRTDQSSDSGAVRRMIEAIRAVGGSPRYSEFCTLGSAETSDHNAWDMTYSLPDLYDWLLRQRRP